MKNASEKKFKTMNTFSSTDRVPHPTSAANTVISNIKDMPKCQIAKRYCLVTSAPRRHLRVMRRAHYIKAHLDDAIFLYHQQITWATTWISLFTARWFFTHF